MIDRSFTISRQAEIRRYGKRAWHSPYRPEDAAMQGLDWIFRHDAELVWACYPYVTGFYAADAATASATLTLLSLISPQRQQELERLPNRNAALLLKSHELMTISIGRAG